MICYVACRDGRACGYKPRHRGPHKPEKICKKCGGGMNPDKRANVCSVCETGWRPTKIAATISKKRRKS